MTIKKQVNPSRVDRTAVAPYNFVPLPEKVLTVTEINAQDQFTGYSGHLLCKLTTASPVYVRGLYVGNDFADLGHKKSDQLTVAEKERRSPFFKLEKKAIIPGSTLRGMFRALLEVASYSKPLAVSGLKFVYRSVDTTSLGQKYRSRTMQTLPAGKVPAYRPRVKAGYMRRNGLDWAIQPAEEIGGVTWGRVYQTVLDRLTLTRTWDSFAHTKVIYFQAVTPALHRFHPTDRPFDMEFTRITTVESKSTGVINKQGVVCRSGYINSKETEAVIYAPHPAHSSPSDWLPVPEHVELTYLENLSSNTARLLGSVQGVFQENCPVFYLEEPAGCVAAVGHCQTLRLGYQNSPYDLLPEEIREPKAPDLAEAIFGYVDRPYQEPSRAGRVFFDDASCAFTQEDEVFHNSIIRPRILSTPKPTSFQHYLVQDQPDNKNSLRDYDDDTWLRGFKFYWHKGPIEPGCINQEPGKAQEHDDEKQYTRIRPVKKGVTFTFTIHFENLSELELGALLWVVRLGARKDCRLSLGMAKPHGYGAVSLQSWLHIAGRKQRYQQLFTANASDWWQPEAAENQPESDEITYCQTGEEETLTPAASKISQSALAQFNDWVCKDPVINPKGCKQIEDLPRIIALLAVLSFPGITDPDINRYLRIRNQDGENEYKTRPVLPDPECVFTKFKSAAHHPHQTTKNPVLPIRPDEKIEVGRMIEALVEAISKNYIYLSFPGREGNDWGQIDKKSGSGIKIGQRWLCRVVGEAVTDPDGLYYPLTPVRRVN